MRESNLFNLLRWPISDTPTASELEALPEDLYTTWLTTAGWRVPAALSCRVVSDYYNNQGRGQARADDVALLRKMIAEYELV